MKIKTSGGTTMGSSALIGLLCTLRQKQNGFFAPSDSLYGSYGFLIFRHSIKKINFPPKYYFINLLY